MDPMLNIAVSAARRAGNIILRYIDRLDGLNVKEKGKNDFVSEVDHAAEAEIIQTIHRAHPDHAIIAEESGAAGHSRFQWIIDPLDGTTNYLHGFPQFAVSIALRENDRLEQAVVYDPMREELFTASRGRGAYLNNRRIRVSGQTRLQHSLLGTGFPFRDHSELDHFLAIFSDLFVQTSGIRRAGAAALDLAYVAAGRLDGFWETGLAPWDMAAGALLIKEAGGMVSDYQGQPDFLANRNIVAGSPVIYSEVLRVLRKHAR